MKGKEKEKGKMTVNLVKGDRIRQTKKNYQKEFANTCANTVLIWEVTRVNKNTYSIKCVEGYMKNSSCKLDKWMVGRTWKDSYYKTLITYEKI